MINPAALLLLLTARTAPGIAAGRDAIRDVRPVRPSWPPGRRRDRLLLAPLCAAQFLVVLDISIVNVALPAMGDDFALAARHLQWVISAYAVTFGGFLLLAGRLADLRGSRSIVIGGLVLFGACSLLCGLSWDAPSLLGGRALQGVGA